MSEVKEAVEEVDGACCGQDSSEKEESLCKEEEEEEVEEEEEEAICRVCHGEGEEGRPLFHPCRCSGSIKYVHQDCLMDWLKLSNKAELNCELCGVAFHFNKKYSKDTPERLGFWEFISGIQDRWKYKMDEMVRAAFLSCWVVALPFFNLWAIEILSNYAFEDDLGLGLSFLKDDFSFIDVIVFWGGGLVFCCYIMLTTLVALQFGHVAWARCVEAATADDEQGINRDVDVDAAPNNSDDDLSVPIHDEADNCSSLDGSFSDSDSEGESFQIESSDSSDNDGDGDNNNGEQDQQNIDVPNALPEDNVEEMLAPVINLFLGRSHWVMLGTSIMLALYQVVYIAVAILGPSLLGRKVIFLFVNESKIRAALSSAIELDEENVQVLISRALVLSGYLVGWVIIFNVIIICIVMLLLFKYQHVLDDSESEFRSSRNIASMKENISNLVSDAKKWAKAGLFVGLEMGVLPQLVGWMLDIITLQALNSTLAARLVFLHNNPFIGGAVHSMLGGIFLNRVDMLKSEVRRILKESVLERMLPFLEDDDIIEDVREQPARKLFQLLVLNIFYCIPSMVIAVMLPVYYGHLFSPFAEPLRMQFNELYYDIQLPLELLVFHFFVPFMAQAISFQQCIRVLVTGYVVHASRVLGIYDNLVDHSAAQEVMTLHPTGQGNGVVHVIENEESVQLPHRRQSLSGVKVLLLVAGGCFGLFLLSSWCIHIPLLLGRHILLTAGLSMDNDLYCICIGFSVVISAGLGLKYIVREAARSSVFSLAMTWASALLKSLVVAVYWLAIAPLLVGAMFQVVFVIPLRTPWNENPSYPLLQCWATGLLLLNFWLRSVAVGLFGRDNPWRIRFNACLEAGFFGINLQYIMREIMLPITINVLDHLLMPYFIARTVGLCFCQSYASRTLVMRFSFPIYFLLGVILMVIELIKSQLAKVHTEIRDSRYLVGTELINQ